MKKLAFFFFLSFLLTACGNNTPKGIGAKFLDCLAAKEFDKAKGYCTPSGVMVLDFMKDKAAEETAYPGRYKVLRDSISGDIAWIFYTDSKDASKRVTKLEMAKVDGKWKVNPTMRK